jgi:hypothetical protein
MANAQSYEMQWDLKIFIVGKYTFHHKGKNHWCLYCVSTTQCHVRQRLESGCNMVRDGHKNQSLARAFLSQYLTLFIWHKIHIDINRWWMFIIFFLFRLTNMVGQASSVVSGLTMVQELRQLGTDGAITGQTGTDGLLSGYFKRRHTTKKASRCNATSGISQWGTCMIQQLRW